MKKLRLLGREPFFVERFQQAPSQVLALQRFQQVLKVTLPIMMEWVSVAALLAVVVILFHMASGEEAVLALAALFAVAMARLKGSLSGVLGAYTQVRSSLVSVDVGDQDLRYLDELREVTSERSEPPWSEVDGPQACGLKQVWYRYPGAEDWALKGIDFGMCQGL